MVRPLHILAGGIVASTSGFFLKHKKEGGINLKRSGTTLNKHVAHRAHKQVMMCKHYGKKNMEMQTVVSADKEEFKKR